MILFLTTIIILIILVIAFLQQPKFGKLPKGERLLKIKQSSNYKNGAFQNINNTPDLTEGVSYWAAGKEFLFGKKVSVNPIDKIPSIKTDLINLDINKDVLAWFGHSSYFIQIDGKRILVDPVLVVQHRHCLLAQKHFTDQTYIKQKISQKLIFFLFLMTIGIILIMKP